MNQISLLHPFPILFSHEMSSLLGLFRLIDCEFFAVGYNQMRQSTLLFDGCMTSSNSSSVGHKIENGNTNSEIRKYEELISRYLMLPCSLMAYLKLQSLIKTNAKKSHILIALKDMKWPLKKAWCLGHVFETALLWSVIRSLQIKLRVY